jgi:hypothetical protein
VILVWDRSSADDVEDPTWSEVVRFVDAMDGARVAFVALLSDSEASESVSVVHGADGQYVVDYRVDRPEAGELRLGRLIDTSNADDATYVPIYDGQPGEVERRFVVDRRAVDAVLKAALEHGLASVESAFRWQW